MIWKREENTMRQRSHSDLALHQPERSVTLEDDSALRRSNSSRVRSRQSFLSGMLQEHMLQVSVPVLRPVAPLVVEPASSSSEEEVPSPIFVATTDHHLLLLGSSNGNGKSAPATPLEDTEIKVVDACDVAAQQEPSPSHAFSKLERHAIKQLSNSTPAMTQAQSPGLGGPVLGMRGPGDHSDSTRAPSKAPSTPQLIHIAGSSKARQKKFHRHFKQVAIEERVLNYYSCALVGDILLQGHLYITKNYFAFYSNVFGYVTKLLIPTVDVLKVSKEKTAKIIPNAVGICTEDEKHVFGSLLSRDSTYKLMVQVWKAATDPVVEAPTVLKHDIEDSASGEMLLDDESSGSGSGNEGRLGAATSLPVVANPETFQKLLPQVRKSGSISIPFSSKNTSQEHWSLHKKCTSLMMLSSVLLIALFLSASFMLYRVIKIQHSFREFPFASNSDDIYEEILKWQSTLHARSSHEMHEFVNANLNQIAKVRLSLEALSMLIVTNEKPYERPSQSKENAAEGSKIS